MEGASSCNNIPAMQKLPASILGQLWPADRAILGIRICKWLRETLLVHVDAVEFHAKIWHKVAVSEDAVAEDLTRFKQDTVRLLRGRRISRLLAKSLFAGFVQASAQGFARSLVRLDLENCDMGDAGAQLLAGPIGECTALQHLNLSGFDLGDEGAARLAHALANCRRLTHLNLCSGRIGAKGARSIASLLTSCSFLTHLNLGMNLLGPEGTEVVAGALRRCCALEELDLRWNGMRDEGAEMVASALPSYSALRSLTLSSNGVGDLGAQQLALVMPACSTLQTLDLGGNVLRDPGATAVADAVRHCNLVHLDVRFNGVEEAGMAVLRGVVRELRWPLCLDVRGNTAAPSECEPPGAASQEGWRCAACLSADT